MPVIPFPSERVFNSATFMCRYIVLSNTRNFSNLHLNFFNFPSHSKNTVCMPVIPFPSERVFNSATFTCRYVVLSTARNVSNLHLNFYFISHLIQKLHYICLYFLFHLKEYSIPQLLCAVTSCLPPLEIS